MITATTSVSSSVNATHIMRRRIWATSEQDGWQMSLLIDPPMFIDSFGVDEQGELYVVDLRSDAIDRLFPAGNLISNTGFTAHRIKLLLAELPDRLILCIAPFCTVCKDAGH